MLNLVKKKYDSHINPPPLVSGPLPKNNCKYSLFFTIMPNMLVFFHLELLWKYVFVVYLCDCEWLYGSYFGRFGGFMAGYKAVAMGRVVLLREAHYTMTRLRLD